MNKPVSTYVSQNSVDNLFNYCLKNKHLEARGSVSSVDSDLSLSFDRRFSLQNELFENTTDEISDYESNTEQTKNNESDNLKTSLVLDEELGRQIIEQIEFYFSDENIIKDAFLLKHVKRNKEGYVSLKLISSFKRVKHLTRDWRVVANALAKSTKLQINELGTKIKRIEPLPICTKTETSKVILVFDKPINNFSITNIAEVYQKYGDILLIHILKPHKPKPAETQFFFDKNPLLRGKPCALVEFETSDSVAKVISETSPDVKVFEIRPNKTKKTKMQVNLNHLNNDNMIHCCNSKNCRCCNFCRNTSSDSRGLKCIPQDYILFSQTQNKTCCNSNSTSRRNSTNSDSSCLRPRSNSDVLMHDCKLRNPIGPSGVKGFNNIHRRPSIPYSSKF